MYERGRRAFLLALDRKPCKGSSAQMYNGPKCSNLNGSWYVWYLRPLIAFGLEFRVHGR